MKFITQILIITLLTSCMTTNSIRTMNRENLIKLSLGMTKQEVLNAMGGIKTITADDGTKINNPWRTEIMKGEDNNYYEILFYYTDIKNSDGAINDNELTPIILSENKVIGWGWSFLNDNVKKYQVEVH
jgi:hypothetical protein